MQRKPDMPEMQACPVFQVRRKGVIKNEGFLMMGDVIMGYKSKKRRFFHCRGLKCGLQE